MCQPSGPFYLGSKSKRKRTTRKTKNNKTEASVEEDEKEEEGEEEEQTDQIIESFSNVWEKGLYILPHALDQSFLYTKRCRHDDCYEHLKRYSEHLFSDIWGV